VSISRDSICAKYFSKPRMFIHKKICVCITTPAGDVLSLTGDVISTLPSRVVAKDLFINNLASINTNTAYHHCVHEQDIRICIQHRLPCLSSSLALNSQTKYKCQHAEIINILKSYLSFHFFTRSPPESLFLQAQLRRMTVKHGYGVSPETFHFLSATTNHNTLQQLEDTAREPLTKC